MNASILALVITGQIAVFQFAAVPFTRSLFTAVLGDPPDPPAGRAAYLERVGRRRFVLGGVLLLLALAGLLGIPGDPGSRKLLLALVSLASSGAFAWGALADRRALRSMRDALPDAGVRRASLRPRVLSQWYGTAWEALPVALLLATVAFSITAGFRLGRLTTEMWVLQILQAAFVSGALVYTFRHGLGVVPVRLAALRDRPELALEFGERLAAREMQYFMTAKVGVTLLLGVSVVELGLRAMDHGAAPLFEAASWVLVFLLLALFAAFILHLVSLARWAESEGLRGERG